MNRLPFDTGRVVLSLQGRDRGRLLAIVEAIDEKTVRIADGKLRKAAHPKLKKTLHLKPLPRRLDNLVWPDASGTLDARLRKELQAIPNPWTANKEECAFVQK